MRASATLLALSGLLGASAFGAATAVHVDLEHGSRHGAAGHDHLPDVSAAAEHAHHPGLPAAEGHAHPHHAESEIPGHSDPGSEDVHQTQSTEHEHALALTADLDRRTGRSPLDRLSNELADPTRSLVCAALSSPRSQPSRASPAARAAPLSRRSVVLQV